MKSELEKLYPVGSLLINYRYVEKSPEDFLGFGKWEIYTNGTIEMEDGPISCVIYRRIE